MNTERGQLAKSFRGRKEEGALDTMRPNSHCVAESSSLGSNPDSSTTDCNLEHIFHLSVPLFPHP